MTKRDPLTLWRRKAERERAKALSATYRADPPGREGPEALEAMDELARMAKDSAPPPHLPPSTDTA